MLTRFKILPVVALVFSGMVGTANADTSKCKDANNHCTHWYGDGNTPTAQDACTVWAQLTPQGENYRKAWWQCCQGKIGNGAPNQPCIAKPDCYNANQLCWAG